MTPQPPSQEQIKRWKELELAAQRNREGNYVTLGIAQSVEHEIWLKGYRAGEAAQDGESSRASTQRDDCETPEPASAVPQASRGDHWYIREAERVPR